MMVSLKNIDTLSYRQLQTAAKRSNVPANLKKSYLIRLLVARSHGDETLIRRIIQEAHRERANSKVCYGDKVCRYEEIPSRLICKATTSRKPNTELEKLLKAPMSTTLNELEVNYRKGQRNSDLYEMRMSKVAKSTRYSFMDQSDKTQSMRRKLRNDSIGEWSKDSGSSYEPYYQSTSVHTEEDNQSDQVDFKPIINTNHEMRMVNPKNHTPKSKKSSSSEYLNVESWTNYESSTSDDNRYQETNGPNSVSKSLVSATQDRQRYRDSDVRTEVRNVITVDEFNRSFGREHMYSRSQSQQIVSSEIPKLDPQDYYLKAPEGIYAKENFIVINQHFQFYSSNYPENRKIGNDASYFENFPTMGSNFTSENKKSVLEKASNKNLIDNNNYKMNTMAIAHNSRVHPGSVNNRANLHCMPVSSNNTNRTAKMIEINKNRGSFKKLQNNNIINTNQINLSEKKVEENSDLFNEFMSLDLRYDTNEDVSSVLQDYFSALDLPENAQTPKIVPPKNMPIIGSEEEVHTSQIEDCPMEEEWEFPQSDYANSRRMPTSMICFLCDWLGKVSDFNNHVKKKHSDNIFKTNDGMLSIAINVGLLNKHKDINQKSVFIEHAENLYVAHFRYKHPDLILPIILSIPPSGQCEIESPLLAMAKFYLQVINQSKEQEMIWFGMIECINIPGREMDLDVFSDRKHDTIEFSMRSLDLVPNNIAMKDIPKYLHNCIVEVHIFIETLADLQVNNNNAQ